MPYETIVVRQRAHARWITLNRPERRNAISAKMVAELSSAVAAAEADPAVRVLLFTGAGKAFCAGADLAAPSAAGPGDGTPSQPGADNGARSPAATGERGSPDMSVLVASNGLFSRIERFPRPVVAVVNGVACAGGLELVLCCDLVLAAESARMADVHANVGLLPGAGGAYRLPRRVGLGMAKYMLFTGDFFTSRQLADAGLVTAVVPDDQLVATADGLAAKLAAKSPLGLSRMKRLVDDGLTEDTAEGIRMGLAANELHLTSWDYREGIASFAQRRAPRFEGR